MERQRPAGHPTRNHLNPEHPRQEANATNPKPQTPAPPFDKNRRFLQQPKHTCKIPA